MRTGAVDRAESWTTGVVGSHASLSSGAIFSDAKSLNLTVKCANNAHGKQ